jgi:hypothetical protein
MFLQYILNIFTYFGFERSPLLSIEDKYTTPIVNKIERECYDMV